MRNRYWCRELIRRAGLKEDIWPALSESWQVAGSVQESAARETGLSRKTRVIFGAGDSAAQLTGNGVIEPGVTA